MAREGALHPGSTLCEHRRSVQYPFRVPPPVQGTWLGADETRRRNFAQVVPGPISEEALSSHCSELAAGFTQAALATCRAFLNVENRSRRPSRSPSVDGAILRFTQGRNMVVDDGQLIVAGAANDAVDFGDGPMSETGPGMFVAKLPQGKAKALRRCYRGPMSMTVRARVKNGRLTPDVPTDLPEVIAVSDDDLDDEDRARLHAALAASEEEFRAGKGIPAAEVIAELRRR